MDKIKNMDEKYQLILIDFMQYATQLQFFSDKIKKREIINKMESLIQKLFEGKEIPKEYEILINELKLKHLSN